MDQIANVIIWVIVIQGIFLGFTYIFSKKSKSNANKILGFFLLAFVFEALSSEFFPYIPIRLNNVSIEDPVYADSPTGNGLFTECAKAYRHYNGR